MKVTDYTKIFPDNLYNITTKSNIYTLLDAFCSELQQIGYTALSMRLNQSLYSKQGFDLDRIFGDPFSIPRLDSEIYEFYDDEGLLLDPQRDPITDAQWSEAMVKDSRYRERLRNFFNAMNLGGCVEGVRMMVNAAIGEDCLVLENFKYQDLIVARATLAVAINSVENTELVLNESLSDFETLGKVAIGNERISYTGRDLGNKKLTGLTRGVDATFADDHAIYSRVYEVEEGKRDYIGKKDPTGITEFTIVPRRAVTKEEERRIVRMVERLKPRDAVVTVDPTGIEVFDAFIPTPYSVSDKLYESSATKVGHARNGVYVGEDLISSVESSSEWKTSSDDVNAIKPNLSVAGAAPKTEGSWSFSDGLPWTGIGSANPQYVYGGKSNFNPNQRSWSDMTKWTARSSGNMLHEIKITLPPAPTTEEHPTGEVPKPTAYITIVDKKGNWIGTNSIPDIKDGNFRYLSAGQLSWGQENTITLPNYSGYRAEDKYSSSGTSDNYLAPTDPDVYVVFDNIPSAVAGGPKEINVTDIKVMEEATNEDNFRMEDFLKTGWNLKDQNTMSMSWNPTYVTGVSLHLGSSQTGKCRIKGYKEDGTEVGYLTGWTDISSVGENARGNYIDFSENGSYLSGVDVEFTDLSSSEINVRQAWAYSAKPAGSKIDIATKSAKDTAYTTNKNTVTSTVSSSASFGSFSAGNVLDYIYNTYWVSAPTTKNSSTGIYIKYTYTDPNTQEEKSEQYSWDANMKIKQDAYVSSIQSKYPGANVSVSRSWVYPTGVESNAAPTEYEEMETANKIGSEWLIFSLNGNKDVNTVRLLLHEKFGIYVGVDVWDTTNNTWLPVAEHKTASLEETIRFEKFNTTKVRLRFSDLQELSFYPGQHGVAIKEVMLYTRLVIDDQWETWNDGTVITYDKELMTDGLDFTFWSSGPHGSSNSMASAVFDISFRGAPRKATHIYFDPVWGDCTVYVYQSDDLSQNFKLDAGNDGPWTLVRQIDHLVKGPYSAQIYAKYIKLVFTNMTPRAVGTYAESPDVIYSDVTSEYLGADTTVPAGVDLDLPAIEQNISSGV